MCGIAGIIFKRDSSKRTEPFVDGFKRAIAHRGPNGAGVHLEKSRAFLNMRLAIVDIAGGNQPIYSEDKRIGIVYNGEVYNYQSIRANLEKLGFLFKTNSDTEVVLRAYEAYGTKAFNMLNGMFGFALWDDRNQEVYLVRDPFGIKPLYLYSDDNQIIFCSEIKGILSVPGLDLELDPAGFQDYLTFRYIQAPFTTFKKIRRIESGSFVRIKDGVCLEFRYWDPVYSDGSASITEKEATEELSYKLKKAVQSQLMGEVPIGVLLSGGLDSSTIAYYVHELGANLKTFNIGFPELNEFQYSSAVAERYELDHIEVMMTVDELSRRLDKVILAIDEPLADPACFPLFRLCEELKKHVIVVLSGEGGDELFGGYPQYSQMISSGVTSNDSFSSFLERSWYFNDSDDYLSRKRLPPHSLRHQKYFIDKPLLNGMLCYDMKTWMPEDLMMKADKILMAHSLEGRFPFLDKDLFEFAATLPQEFKIHPDGTTKWILRELIAPKLPDEIITRPKMGFSVPVEQLLKRQRSLVFDIFEDLPRTALNSVLDSKELKNLVADYYSGKRQISPLKIWTYFVLVYWFKHAFANFNNTSSRLAA